MGKTELATTFYCNKLCHKETLSGLAKRQIGQYKSIKLYLRANRDMT